MIVFREKTLVERLLDLIPSRRKARQEAMREAIRSLVADPSAPCKIGGEIIKNGYGKN